MGVQAAGHDDGTAINNAIDQVIDIAPADGGDLPACPDRQGAALDDALDQGAGAVVRLIALEPFVGYCCEGVSCGRPLMLGAFALIDRLASVAPGLAGCGERHTGPASQRQPLLL